LHLLPPRGYVLGGRKAESWACLEVHGATAGCLKVIGSGADIAVVAVSPNQGALNLGGEDRTSPGIRMARCKEKAEALGLHVRRSGSRGLYRLVPTHHAVVPIELPAMPLDKLEQVLMELASEYVDGCP